MRRSFYTLSALTGFLAGTGLYPAIQPGILWTAGAFLLFSVIFWMFRGRRAACFLLFIAAGALGLLRAGFSEHRATPADIYFYNGQTVELTGVVTETDVRRDKAKYQLSLENYPLRIEDNIYAVSGVVLVSAPKYPQYLYGDVLQVYGELEAPGEFDGFSYDDYLSRFGIYSVMYRPKAEVVARGEGNWFWRGMTTIQGIFMDRINRLFPEPHGSFEAGLLVGARKGIPPDLMEKFNITGLTHIIAISGYNITIIIVFVMWMLSGLPRRAGFFVAVLAIIFFTLFVGASPAVTRAGIMGILGLVALNSGRQNHIHITVFFSAALMVLYNPKILWFDVGFQLSFAAVAGLVYVAPLFEKWGRKLPTAFGMREAILMTLSAQVMALPIIVYNFERLSLIAPLVNLLVAFAIPPAMLFGFAAVIFSFVFYPLAIGLAYIAWGILSYIIAVIKLMAAVPYASVNVGKMGFFPVVFYYAVLAAFLWWRFQRQKD